MSLVRIDPLVSIVRFYGNKVDPKIPLHSEKTPYSKTINIQFLDNGRARIQGAAKMPNRKELKDLWKTLKEMGYVHIEWRHKDKTFEYNI